MITRKLGRSGIEVSALGMGCWAIGGPWQFHRADGESNPAGWGEVDDQESLAALRAALDAGISFFDTAANYGAGHSERLVGQALKGRRDEVVIATKFGFVVDEDQRTVRTDHSQVLPNIRSDCENSLRRLDTDYIDVFQLHVGDFDPEHAVEVRHALESLVDEGKIRSYGWSTDDADRARVFAAGEHGTAVQFAYNVFSQKYSVLRLLDENNLGGIVRSPLAMGILSGKMTRETTFPANDVRQELDFHEGRPAQFLEWMDALRSVLTAAGHTPVQGALSWILTGNERVVPIPGFRTVAQVEENVATLRVGMLSMDQMITIEGIRASSIDTVRAYYNPRADDRPAEAG